VQVAQIAGRVGGDREKNSRDKGDFEEETERTVRGDGLRLEASGRNLWKKQSLRAAIAGRNP
jgi:hypothetical protein